MKLLLIIAVLWGGLALAMTLGWCVAARGPVRRNARFNRARGRRLVVLLVANGEVRRWA